MKVTGYKLQQAIREQTERRNLAESRFSGSLKAFEDEKKPSPISLMDEFEDAERQIALLQASQARYNLAVQVEAGGQKLTLHEAVKLVGGASRVEKKWREAAKDDADPYGRSTVRDRDSIIAKAQVEPDKCASLAQAAAKRVRVLRYAIQKGNATEIDLPNVDLALDD